MKITNELREYIQRRVVEIVPEPTSKEAHDIVYAECKKLAEEYSEYLEEASKAFLEDISKNTIVKGCVFKTYRNHGLGYDVSGSKEVQQYLEEQKQQTEFRIRISEKIFALLSVQKEIADLDEFIANVVNSMFK